MSWRRWSRLPSWSSSDSSSSATCPGGSGSSTRSRPPTSNSRASSPSACARSRSAGLHHELECRRGADQGLFGRRGHRQAFLDLLHGGGPPGRGFAARARNGGARRQIRSGSAAGAGGWNALRRQRGARRAARRFRALVGFAKITRDVTERHRQQAELEEARLALAQSQKMEALGQLSSGIAHDFNNLLHVIKNAAAILQRRLPEGNADLRGAIEMIERSADRAARLTQRLLAFSRRQPLQPQRLDPCELITGMVPLLKSALGESIELQIDRGRGAWCTSVDPSQLETALLNLAVNARDAVPRGGKLTVEITSAGSSSTRPASAGRISRCSSPPAMRAPRSCTTGASIRASSSSSSRSPRRASPSGSARCAPRGAGPREAARSLALRRQRHETSHGNVIQ